MDMQNYQGNASLPAIPEQQEVMTLDQAILGWIAEMAGKSESVKTEKAYRDGLTSFRSLLQRAGKDFDSPASIVAPILQGWADYSERKDEDGKPEKVTPATFNQRVAIISSFYRYAMRHDVLPTNAAARVKRRKVNHKNAARHLSVAQVKEGLSRIDRNTLEGKRDYAILSLAVATGRRVSELAGLRYGHLHKDGKTVEVEFVRCKGNKQESNVLHEKTTAVIYEYLRALYGDDLRPVSKDAPIWVSFSDRNKGKPISPRTLQRICEEYLGTSKMHATRHTYAVTMHNSGASLAEIGKGLGHSNLKVTSDYLEQHLGNENKYGSTLETLFGI